MAKQTAIGAVAPEAISLLGQRQRRLARRASTRGDCLSEQCQRRSQIHP
ncbi:MAG: hypothetical protein F6K36_11620 [Symploca sp. SIO3C6]|uniref:Uncharacterized protein n=1 Tax=Symploca sp. SIO1C4 TaxID=2607765 RepID=A0A6B3N8D3_9CYAN|nr:hypothetical protein [Symploca sp. SIO3C6]NER27115.1 hypothetical protein [Symploca sp. SIO1C4]NET07977.1 hypothetical protein [Symploca sp. SIO2B6]NET50348.1 hypothetical protein [Merismopedia sp. SIO2A8]